MSKNKWQFFSLFGWILIAWPEICLLWSDHKWVYFPRWQCKWLYPLVDSASELHPLLTVQVTLPPCWQCKWVTPLVDSASDFAPLLTVQVSYTPCWQCKWVTPLVDSASDFTPLLTVQVTLPPCWQCKWLYPLVHDARWVSASVVRFYTYIRSYSYPLNNEEMPCGEHLLHIYYTEIVLWDTPVWNLTAVIWFHFTISSLVLLPTPYCCFCLLFFFLPNDLTFFLK